MIDDVEREQRTHVMFAMLPFFLFFSIPLFTAKGAYELISIANLRFWPGLSATPLRQ